MQWILVAITMATNGQPHEFRQVAQFETRAVCEYAPEALRTRPTETLASQVVDEAGTWVVSFRCVPATEAALVEELDAQEQAARFIAGEGAYATPWWQERLEQSRAIAGN